MSRTMQTQDYYNILNLTPTASPEDVRNAFKRVALKFHPDKAPPQKRPLYNDIMKVLEYFAFDPFILLLAN